LNSKKLEDKLEYKRNTALPKREVRKRKRLSWDKFVTNLEHDIYRTQPKVYKILKQISKGKKEAELINPSAWSDGHCPHTVNITCRGVTGTARIQ
jgi:hypothetical protein